MEKSIVYENQKRFNGYVFLSTFARNLIEVFIGTILYKAGFALKDVIFYYLLINIFSLVLDLPFVHILKKNHNKLLIFIGIGAFVILQVLLNNILLTKCFLTVLALLYSVYRRAYWISRKFYNLMVMQKENISKDYSIISIMNQIGIISASYVGALLLEYISIRMLTIISVILFGLSIVFLSGINIETTENEIKIDIVNTIKRTSVSYIINFGCYELQYIIKILIPLYLYIYIQQTYTIIGIVNLVVNMATIVLIFTYGNLINKEKNYLKLSIVLVVLTYILKINTFGLILIVVSFIEGFVIKMYEQSLQKEYFILSSEYDYYNYTLLYEYIQNVFRIICTLVIFLFVKDLKMMIYFTIVFMGMALFINIGKNKKTKQKENIEEIA